MIISASLILRPRRARYCDLCRKPIEGPQVRLYGYAERPDPPYAIYEHPDCARQCPDPKIARALATPPPNPPQGKEQPCPNP